MILNPVTCDFCASNEYQIVYSAKFSSAELQGQMACTNTGHGEYFQLVQCKKCGLHFSSPRPLEQELESAYEGVIDHVYEEEQKGRVITFRRNLNSLHEFKKSGDLLDIGCATGVFLKEANSRGWNVFGIEPSSWGVKQAKSTYQLNNILQGSFSDIKKFNSQFDVITMWDVLEHIHSPKQALNVVHQYLKPGGIFAFSTVDFGSLYAKCLGKNWPWLMKMHIYYFNREIIKKYLTQAGFKIRKIRVYEHTVSLKYLEYKMKSFNTLVYRLLGAVNSCYKKDLYVTIAMGDFMEIYAEKR